MDRSTLLGLHAILRAADENGVAKLHDAAIQYREDTLAAMRADGKDVEREAGLLGVDQARANLLNTVIPRLTGERLIIALALIESLVLFALLIVFVKL